MCSEKNAHLSDSTVSKKNTIVSKNTYIVSETANQYVTTPGINSPSPVLIHAFNFRVLQMTQESHGLRGLGEFPWLGYLQ